MRLSSQLLRLSEKVGTPSNGHIDIELSRRNLAQMIDTTILTVSRLLSLWQNRASSNLDAKPFRFWTYRLWRSCRRPNNRERQQP